MNCPSCESDRVVRHGRPNGRQTYRCKDCGRSFTNDSGYDLKMKHRRGMVQMAVHLIKMGMSTRDVVPELERIYRQTVSSSTVSLWAKKNGVVFQGRARLKPCTYCGSRTLHKHNCPVFKQIYDDVKQRRREKQVDVMSLRHIRTQ